MKRLLFLLCLMVIVLTGCSEASEDPILTSTEYLPMVKVGVLTGGIEEIYAFSTFESHNIVLYDTYEEAVMGLKEEDVSAILSDTRINQITGEEEGTLKQLGNPLKEYPIAMAVKPDNLALFNQLNDYLSIYKANQAIPDTIKEWEENRGVIDTIEGWDKSKGTLTVGIDPRYGLPYGDVEDGDFLGYGIEIARGFGVYMDREIQFVTMAESEFHIALAEGTVDFVINFAITNDRKKEVLFTRSYSEYIIDTLARDTGLHTSS